MFDRLKRMDPIMKFFKYVQKFTWEHDNMTKHTVCFRSTFSRSSKPLDKTPPNLGHYPTPKDIWDRHENKSLTVLTFGVSDQINWVVIAATLTL